MDISVKFYGGDCLSDCQNIGYAGFDYSFPAAQSNAYILSDEHTQGIERLKRDTHAHGIRVCQTHLTYPFGTVFEQGNYEEYEEYMLPLLIREIELTAASDCTTAVLHPYYCEQDRENTRQGNIRLISKLLPTLEKTGVVLSLENIYGPSYHDVGLTTAEDLLYYVEYFDSPYVGVCLDTGHAVTLGQDPVKMLQLIGNRLTALHVHTTIPGRDLHAIPYCVNYYEQIDWDAFWSTLCSTDYKGTFNLEVKPLHKMCKDGVQTYYRLAYEVVQGIMNKNLPVQ